MSEQIKRKRVFLGVASFLFTISLIGCKGTEVDKATSSSSSSSKITGTVVPDIPAPTHYLAKELQSLDMFNPEQIQVDAKRGVIYIPQGGIGENQVETVPVLVSIDLATGLSGSSYGIVSRAPSRLVVLSATHDAVASVIRFGTENIRSEVFIKSLNEQPGFIFEVNHSIAELKFNDQYVFTLNDARHQIHQYNASTGELLSIIDEPNVDDWLIAQKTQTLYVLRDNEVVGYDFSKGAAIVSSSPHELPNVTSRFGWLSPDETRLYQHSGEVFSLPGLENISPILSTFADARRTFLDLAFVPDSNLHYTIEGYSAVDGDVFLSTLANYAAKPVGLVGRRVFVTSAGVHVYAYENGKHMLYALTQSGKDKYTEGEIKITSSWVRPAFDASRFAAYELVYPVGTYAKAWSDLFLQFDVVDMKDYYHSDQIIVEPICFNEGCASGRYSATIPLERRPMHFSIHLADWFDMHDIRGLIGFRVRTPEKSWDNFTIENNVLTNAYPSDCKTVGDLNVALFCDQ